jgi:hypothetical protein
VEIIRYIIEYAELCRDDPEMLLDHQHSPLNEDHADI